MVFVCVSVPCDATAKHLPSSSPKTFPLAEITTALRESNNPWLDVVENDKAASMERLTLWLLQVR